MCVLLIVESSECECYYSSRRESSGGGLHIFTIKLARVSQCCWLCARGSFSLASLPVRARCAYVCRLHRHTLLLLLPLLSLP